jgi:hypothetical protein
VIQQFNVVILSFSNLGSLYYLCLFRTNNKGTKKENRNRFSLIFLSKTTTSHHTYHHGDILPVFFLYIFFIIMPFTMFFFYIPSILLPSIFIIISIIYINHTFPLIFYSSPLWFIPALVVTWYNYWGQTDVYSYWNLRIYCLKQRAIPTIASNFIFSFCQI